MVNGSPMSGNVLPESLVEKGGAGTSAEPIMVKVIWGSPVVTASPGARAGAERSVP
jgi:hypothetical protein